MVVVCKGVDGKAGCIYKPVTDRVKVQMSVTKGA